MKWVLISLIISSVLDIEIKLDEEGFMLPATQCEEVHTR